MLKDISAAVDNSIPMWILWVFSLLLIVLYAIVYIIDKIGINTTKKIYRILFRKRGKLTKWKLRHHEFFEHMLFLLDYRINTLSFSNSNRDAIMKDFLHSYINSLYEYHLDILNLKINKLSKEELKDILKSTLIQSIENHENKFILSTNNPDERETIKLIINKFNETYYKVIEGQLTAINKIFEYDKIYESNHELVYTIFNIHHSMIVLLVTRVSELFKTLNGELSGLYYNGKVIEDAENNI